MIYEHTNTVLVTKTSYSGSCPVVTPPVVEVYYEYY